MKAVAELHDPDALMRPEEAARFLGLSRSRIYAETCKGSASKIPFVRIGRFIRFRRADLLAFIESNIVGGGAK